MPKYSPDKVCDHYLYFTSFCTIEAMHVHASDRELSEVNSAKLFVYSNGDTKIERRGTVNDVDMRKIQKYIKLNYKEMYSKWEKWSEMGYYNNRKE